MHGSTSLCATVFVDDDEVGRVRGGGGGIGRRSGGETLLSLLLMSVSLLMASMLVTGTSGCLMNTSGEVGTLSVGDPIREREITTSIRGTAI